MTRQQFESELTGEMVAAGIDPAVAARHVQQFWNGAGYSDPDLQQKWQQHCRTCALPDDCTSCPHAGEDECCGGAV